MQGPEQQTRKVSIPPPPAPPQGVTFTAAQLAGPEESAWSEEELFSLLEAVEKHGTEGEAAWDAVRRRPAPPLLDRQHLCFYPRSRHLVLGSLLHSNRPGG